MDPRTAIARVLRNSTRVLIVCHAGPDGDCLGSGLALAAALRRIGVRATVASPDGVPVSLAFLPGADDVVTSVGEGDQAQVAVVLECSSLERVGPLEPAVRRARTIVAIDHHPDHQPYADLTDWDPASAAVGVQVADLIGRLGVAIDRSMATCLLAAIVTDTGVFRYANTRPDTLRLAADLMDRGALMGEIVRAVYEEQPPPALRLMGLALAKMALHCGGAIAATVITPGMLAASGARPEDASGIAAALRTVAGVRVAMSFEERSGRVHVSIRTRDDARADHIARALGGGGHHAAAGADVAGGLDEVVRRALEAAVREVGAGGGGRPDDQ